MADRAIKDLDVATEVTSEDMFVLEQNGVAKNLKGNVLKLWLLKMADGRGGIDRIEKTGSNGLVDIYTIIYANETTSTFTVTNGKSITGIAKVSSADLVDTYRISYNDGSATDFTVTNGAKGDKGDNAYVHVKWASQLPTEAYHDMGDIPDDYIGIYSGNLSTAPLDWAQYKWFQYKGEKGDTGDPAQVVSAEVVYQLSENGTTPPTGAWSEIIPTVPQGRFLWTRTTVMFNTGNPVVSYSAVRNGVDGKGSVTTVNGKSPDTTGNVALTASDVGARPDYWMPTAGDVGARPDTWLPSLPEIGAAPAEQLATFVRPNLLDNWYFGNPVNQRGKKSYDGAVYAIDRWRTWFDNNAWMTVSDGGIKIKTTAWQYIDESIYKSLIGKTVTISILMANGALYSGSFFIKNTGEWYTVPVNNYGIKVIRIEYNPWESSPFIIEPSEIGVDSELILAVKLELGSTQTLAHQENGVWVLNEIPDFAEQLMKCQIKNDDGVIRTDSTFVRPNLLDNWYFLNPVNQRGKEEVTEAVYGIDRWRKTTGSSMTLLIRPEGLTSTGSAESMYMRQFFDDKSKLLGKMVTASVLYKNAGLITTTVYYAEANGRFVSSRDGIVFSGVSTTFPLEIIGLSIYPDDYAIAAKLEIGPNQTLAHQENGQWVLNEIPNYAEQLARCQRHYFPLVVNGDYIAAGHVTGNTQFHFPVHLPQEIYGVPLLRYKDLHMTIRTISGYSAAANENSPYGTPIDVGFYKINSSRDVTIIFKFGGNVSTVNNTPATVQIRSGKIAICSEIGDV